MSSRFSAHPSATLRFCKTCEGVEAVVEPVADGRARARRCPSCAASCSACDGRGYIYAMDADGQVAAIPCACQSLEERIRAYNLSGIPARYANATLSGFEAADNPSLVRAKNHMIRFVRDYAPGRRGVLLTGSVGIGKTHLAAALVRDLCLAVGVRARLIEFSHLLSQIKAGYDAGRSESDTLGDLVDTPLLFVDELGKGLSTEWQLTILDELVSKRYNRGATTCFTTNFPVEPPTASARRSREHFDVTTLEARVGARIFSRICEVCDIVSMTGEDYRRRHAHAQR